MIRLQNVTLGYGRDIVLSKVNLEITQGAFLPFVGPNGAGKTTLLRSILGLIKPISGSIDTPFQKAPAGYIPQHRSIDALFPLTVREIVAMGFYPQLGWWRNPAEPDRNRLDGALAELKLTEHAHKNYRDLSGGTKQKTLIARALVSGAEVLIMDEPTSELDEASERTVFEHLANFVLREKKTVMIAHHGLNDFIRSLAKNLCVVNQGRVQLMPVSDFKGFPGM